jgi:peptide/nickel transport system permease protein
MFGIDLELLWTDALIFLLVAVIVVFVVYARNKEHLAAPWRQVFRKHIAMAALVILTVFVAIGLLDSIHYRDSKSAEVLSAFDYLAVTLRQQVEKTYSAPFATHLYAKETIELNDGSTIRDYPRLRYGGAHLQVPANKVTDISERALKGILTGVTAWSVLTILLLAILAKRQQQTLSHLAIRIWQGHSEIPWKTILGSIGVITVIFAILAQYWGVYHMLGTDKVGQDVFYQSLKSIRTGLVIGTLTTLIMLPFALMLGIMAGYLRGWVDDIIQYLYTTLNSIPGVLLIAAAVLMLDAYMANHPNQFSDITTRADARLLFLCMILGITSWTGLCRLLRAESLKLSQVDYIQAATAFGVSRLRIITRHLLPNVMHIVMISIVLDFSGLVLAEAILSYVGVGVDPSMNSWGNMINSARLEMAREPIVWWSILAAFIFMFTLVLAANLFSDAVRDAFDPRLRKG